MPNPRIGQVENGYRYKGGNPNNPSSWERVQAPAAPQRPRLAVGAVVDGFRYNGGDPNNRASWQAVQAQRPAPAPRPAPPKGGIFRNATMPQENIIDAASALPIAISNTLKAPKGQRNLMGNFASEFDRAGQRRAAFKAGMVNGATLGFGDEAVGLISRRARNDVRQAQSEAKANNPYAYLGGQFVGGGATGGAALGTKVGANVARVARAAPVRANAVGGGVVGAIQGAGDADNGNRTGGAIGGGILGASTGAALPLINRGAGVAARGVRNAANRVRGRSNAAPRLSKPEQEAINLVRNNPDLQKTYDDLVAVGIKPTIADLNTRVARRAGTYARMDNGGAARDLAANRASDMLMQVPSAAGKLVRKASNVRGTKEQIKQGLTAAKRRGQNALIKPIEGNMYAPESTLPLKADLVQPSIKNTLKSLQADVLNNKTQGDDYFAFRDMLKAQGAPDAQSASMGANAFDPYQSRDFDYMDSIVKDAVGAKPIKPNENTLYGAIKNMGGINDESGEIAFNLGRTIPGIINNNKIAMRGSSAVSSGKGNSLDDMAAQLGDYFKGASGVTRDDYGRVQPDDVLDLIRKREADPELYRYGYNPEYMQSVWDARAKRNTDLPDPTEYAFERFANSDPVIPPQAPIEGVGETPQMSIRAWENLRQNLGAQKDAAFEKTDQSALARKLQESYDTLFNPIRQAEPRYNQALGLGNLAKSQIDAIDVGSGFNNMQRPDIVDTMASMTRREQRGARQGFANSLAQEFIDDRNRWTRLQQMAGGQDFTGKLRDVFGDNAASQMQQGANVLNQRAETARAINPNFGSQTAERSAEQNMIDGLGMVASPRAGALEAARRFATSVLVNKSPAYREQFIDFATRELEPETLRFMIDSANESIRLGQPINPELLFLLQVNGVNLMTEPQ